MNVVEVLECDITLNDCIISQEIEIENDKTEA